MRLVTSGQQETALPNWLPSEVKHYLAHTGAGVSIRDIARLSQCHASTISRRIARIEQQRDDPLVDAALSQIEDRLKSSVPGVLGRIKREIGTMSKDSAQTGQDVPKDLEQEAKRVLRRLCETGAVLAIAEDMDVAVVVREGPDGTTTRTAVVAQEIAQAMALRGWIETVKTGRIMRYGVTVAGREKVKALLIGDDAMTPGAKVMAMAEAPARFETAPGDWSDARPSDDGEAARKLRYNLAESPLTILARRRDKNGEPFLSDDLVRCGERLREDFELAQMGAQTGQNWHKLLAGDVPEAAPTGPAAGFGPEAAKSRVVLALRELGPGLSDVALRCCCYLEGLESTEKRMGWSARSGKVVLRIALQRLKRHYEETLTPEAQMIG